MLNAVLTPETKDTRSVQKGEQKGTIAVLDGVRAFACLSVIAFHINRLTLGNHVWFMASVNHVIADIALAGFSGVTLFFILSGFLLFMTYARSMLYDKPWPEMKRFYLRRIFRIWPGYYVSLLLLVLFAHREYLRPDHFRQSLLFLTFLMDSRQSTFQKLNGPFWTLAIEWQFYMLLPLLALAMRWIVQRGSLQRRFVLLVTCIGALAVWGIVTRWWGYSWMTDPHQPLWLPAPVHNVALFFLYGRSGKYLEDFALGMLICALYTLALYSPEAALCRLCRRYSRLFWWSGILCLLFAATWSETPMTHMLAKWFATGRPLQEFFYATGYGCCMLALLFGPPRLRRFWEWGPLRWLGLLSYGLYIWHLPLLFLFSSYIAPSLSGIGMRHLMLYGCYWLWAIAIVLPAGYLFHRLIELPWIKVGSYVTNKKT